MDYPEAWRFVRENLEPHDRNCSWALTNGAILCDCHIIFDEYARRRAAGSADTPRAAQ